jgi:hypothetical protein
VGDASITTPGWERRIERIPKILPEYRKALGPYLQKLNQLFGANVKFRHYEAPSAHALLHILAAEVLLALSPIIESGVGEVRITPGNRDRAIELLKQLGWSDPVIWWCWKSFLDREIALLELRAMEQLAEDIEISAVSDVDADNDESDAKALFSQARLPEITVNMDLQQARYNGQVYELTASQALGLKALVDARGNAVSWSKLGITKPSEVKKSLPKELRDLIETSPGKGYWLKRLP